MKIRRDGHWFDAESTRSLNSKPLCTAREQLLLRVALLEFQLIL